jgi:hypothetical protein
VIVCEHVTSSKGKTSGGSLFEVHDMTFKRASVALAITGLAALAASGIAVAESRLYGNASSAPVLAIVGLSEQRVSIYDAAGAKILESPVSSGATDYETPAGIYSVVQKEEDHRSNLYDDASMPFMERITWTGMALHAGELPGRPASHGCVRLPLEFAERLYELTELGMRVVVAREDIAPVETPQPALFKSRAEPKAETPDMHLVQLRSIANAKTAEADASTMREKETREAAAKGAAEAASAVRTLRRAETSLASAEAEVKAAERALEKANSPARTTQAEGAKAKALAKVEAAQARLQAAKLQAQSKTDAATHAEGEAQAAAAAMNIAAGAAEEAKQDMSPVSVFVSRKTQRLYIRKNNYPVFEAPVMIRDADKPIGTFVFTALSRAEASGEMRWNVVSLYKNPTNIEPYKQAQRPRTKARRGDPPPVTDAAAAQLALDRLVAPQEAIDRVSAVVLPGSSLIISDEGPSAETGKDTDFVVFMSGEPQGGITIRRHETANRGEWDDEDYASSRGRRSSGGAFGFFFPE